MSHNASEAKNLGGPGRGRIYGSIGDTPIVRLDKLAKEKGVKSNLLAKLPIASVKDHIGVAMIEALEKAGKLSRARPSSSSRRQGYRHRARLRSRAEGLSPHPDKCPKPCRSSASERRHAAAIRESGQSRGSQAHHGRPRKSGTTRRLRWTSSFPASGQGARLPASPRF